MFEDKTPSIIGTALTPSRVAVRGYFSWVLGKTMQDGITPFFLYGSDTSNCTSPRPIPTTARGLDEAIDEGIRFFSPYAYSRQEEIEPPLMIGGLSLRFRCPENPQQALSDAGDILHTLNISYGVALGDVPIWLEGAFDGVTLDIPAEIFGGEQPQPKLNVVHLTMLEGLLAAAGTKIRTVDRTVFQSDNLLWAGGTCDQRQHFKVRITDDVLQDMRNQDLLSLVSGPRPFIFPENESRSKAAGLRELYLYSFESVYKPLHADESSQAVKSLEECLFVKHCLEQKGTITEVKLAALAALLSKAGAKGRRMLHEFLSASTIAGEMDLNTIQNWQSIRARPLGCLELKQIYDCGTDCQVDSPLGLNLRGNGYTRAVASCFNIEADGVYYGKPNVEDDPVWLCSPLEVLAKSRDTSDSSWGRLVGLVTPGGRYKAIHIPMMDFSGSGEGVRQKLLDAGLEIAPVSKAQQLVLDYLRSSQPERYIRLVSKTGWHGDAYVLPDVTYGHRGSDEFHLITGAAVSGQSVGTLDEWREHVARPAMNSELLLLLLSFALTGPLLRPFAMDGGGIHIFGQSSCGKTTALRVAGSVCGGGASGYLTSWRTTDNGLEGIASRHNDNLLCLDEIGQASSRVTGESVYMLANGQGKARARRDGSPGNLREWQLMFLSNGEKTLDDKLSENGGSRAMAGQAVRVIDLPADAGLGYGIFNRIDGFPDSGSLSAHLSAASMKYYGKPLRRFLELLTADKASVLANIRSTMDAAIKCDSEVSGQVQRVAKRFALAAAAGEQAIEWGIFPWPPGAILQAAGSYFDIWLQGRGGTGSAEMENTIKQIKEFFEISSETRFVAIPDDHFKRGTFEQAPPRDFVGYRWKEQEQWYFLVLSAHVKSMWCRHVSLGALREELLHRGYLALNTNGKRMETKHIPGLRSVRGEVFIPQTWENEEQG